MCVCVCGQTWCRDDVSVAPWTPSGWVCRRRRRWPGPASARGSDAGSGYRGSSVPDSLLPPSRSYPKATAAARKHTQTHVRYDRFVTISHWIWKHIRNSTKKKGINNYERSNVFERVLRLRFDGVWPVSLIKTAMAEPYRWARASKTSSEAKFNRVSGSVVSWLPGSSLPSGWRYRAAFAGPRPVPLAEPSA